MSLSNAKGRLDQGSGEPSTQFVSVSDLKTAFDDLAAQWTSDISAVTAAAGGYGPNWVAASNAPAAVKNAVLAGGGAVASGSADNAVIAARLATYQAVYLTEGDFTISSTIVMPQGRTLAGSGVRATRLNGASGLSGSFISITSDHTMVTRMTISSGSETAAHGIDAAITSQTGFTTGADGCTVLSELVLRNIKGDGIRMTGYNNRDSKTYNVHVWNATGRGFFFDCPDGSAQQIVAGTCGSHGVEIGTGSANWRITNAKSWYSDGDGFLVQSVRHTLVNVEAQDNMLAGIRILGYLVTVNGFLADSNSFDGGTGLQNVHSGVEVGRTSSGTTSGGGNVVLANGQAWDKNEGSRGRMQRSGIRLRSTVRDLILIGVSTGNGLGGSHSNYTEGIEFDNPSDITHSSNIVWAASHSVIVGGSGGGGGGGETIYADNISGSAQETTVTGTTLTTHANLSVEVPGNQKRYRVEGVLLFRADSTQHLKMAVCPEVVTGSGSPEGFMQYTFQDTTGASTVASKYLNASGTNAVSAQGASANGGTSTSVGEVRTVTFAGSVYLGSTVTTGSISVKVAESVGTGTGVKALVNSWIRVTPLS